jgi:hypothetical protein
MFSTVDRVTEHRSSAPSSGPSGHLLPQRGGRQGILCVEHSFSLGETPIPRLNRTGGIANAAPWHTLPLRVWNMTRAIACSSSTRSS